MLSVISLNLMQKLLKEWYSMLTRTCISLALLNWQNFLILGVQHFKLLFPQPHD